METSLKTGFAQISLAAQKNLSYLKFQGGCSSPRHPRKSQSVNSKSKLTSATTLYFIHFVLLKNFNLFFSVLWQGNNYNFQMNLKQKKEIYPTIKWTHNIII